jgi:hypothetical protein
VTHEQAVQTLATERYLLDEMSGADREAFEDHFFSCEICADDIRVASAMVKGAKAGFASSPIQNPAWYRSTLLPWASAAALAVVTVYQTLWVVPSLREGAPSATIPVTLRPASRGAEPLVPLTASGPVSLAIEINEPADSGRVTYTLRSSDGREIASGVTAAPAAGAPLLLLVPSSALTGSTRYTLSIGDAGPSHHSLGEYRFTVSR